MFKTVITQGAVKALLSSILFFDFFLKSYTVLAAIKRHAGSSIMVELYRELAYKQQPSHNKQKRSILYYTTPLRDVFRILSPML